MLLHVRNIKLSKLLLFTISLVVLLTVVTPAPPHVVEQVQVDHSDVSDYSIYLCQRFLARLQSHSIIYNADQPIYLNHSVL